MKQVQEEAQERLREEAAAKLKRAQEAMDLDKDEAPITPPRSRLIVPIQFSFDYL